MAVHKAAPADREAAHTSCLHCKEEVHRVPGGEGVTYVHTRTGAVAAHTPGTPHGESIITPDPKENHS